MLETLRKWGKRYTSSTKPNAHLPGANDRVRRAKSIEDLRLEVSRLQHDISELSDAMTKEGHVASAEEQSRMDALHQQLTSTQRELAKYQGRI